MATAPIHGITSTEEQIFIKMCVEKKKEADRILEEVKNGTLSVKKIAKAVSIYRFLYGDEEGIKRAADFLDPDKNYKNM